MDLIIFILDAITTPEGRPNLYLMLLTLAGVLMIVGLRKASISLIVITIVTMVLGSPAFEAMFDSIFDQLPGWAFWSLVGVMAYGFVRWVMVRILGDERGEKATRKGAFWVIREILFAPFKLVWLLLKSGPAGRWVLLILLLACIWGAVQVFPIGFKL
jgi:hypothetical protein